MASLAGSGFSSKPFELVSGFFGDPGKAVGQNCLRLS